ncbi:MAG: acyl-CoA dehydrogenase family protein, partial [Spongiibacter sp.]|nr:acyl-CoA dehydrogenase family protein [Spongiibacter sp.]
MAELNFALSDEQRLLRDSCEGFVQAEYSLAQRAASLEHPAKAEELWQKLAEQGHFHLAVSEALGGLAQVDAALENLALTAEVMGTALMALPLANGAIYPARLLSGLVEAGVSQSVCEGLIEPLLSGGGPIYVCPVVVAQNNGVHVGNGAVEFAAALSRSQTLGGEAISFSVESLVTMTASPSGSDSHGLSGSLLLLVPDGESCQLISLPLKDPRLSRYHYRLLDDRWAMTVSGRDIDVCAGVRVSAAA